MEKFDAWIVAAAILATGDGPDEQELHFRTLADRVVGSELTTLGDKGETPPSQTLGVQLRRHDDVFGTGCRGYYNLIDRDQTMKRPDVARGIDGLKQRHQKQHDAGELQALRREVGRLKERNAALERKISEIAEICNPLVEV